MTQLNIPNAVVIPDGKRTYRGRNGTVKTTVMTLDMESALRVLMLGFFQA